MVHVLSWETEVLSLLLKVRVVIDTSSKACSRIRIRRMANTLEQVVGEIPIVCSWIRMVLLQ